MEYYDQVAEDVIREAMQGCIGRWKEGMSIREAVVKLLKGMLAVGANDCDGLFISLHTG